MMNPFVVEHLAHMRHEERQREIEQDRLLKALPKRQLFSPMQALQTPSQAFKAGTPRSRTETAPSPAGAEC